MADAKKPDDKEDPKPVTRPDDDPAEMSNDELDKIAGGLMQQRFNTVSPRPFSTS